VEINVRNSKQIAYVREMKPLRISIISAYARTEFRLDTHLRRQFRCNQMTHLTHCVATTTTNIWVVTPGC